MHCVIVVLAMVSISNGKHNSIIYPKALQDRYKESVHRQPYDV